ncbi:MULTISPECIES: amino-acid N-acetyltransferase [unclassified Colwellia]|uniref:amino-acid N-acetyltransferase n=1 Tax=unclassified Colwellia TaxID=196834 RepID=UPI0015F53563|nr:MULTISPECIES: amino-acid N-acetyltransferase [unclassified Colwellia]MBA6232302.1 amino-acid N-acetyltransferase [Colwellia sp. MB02u-7]MBA6237706.1 amino-acid N-acetyltransferase [Colwellia sp. MB02u-11]MBA6257831.1 amino-acid N-acetyltransferase [Colwellia sp. MB3u-28]MBA6260888.1 amino-acid N-acetyltransferase [Colwellia sp. MB3u-41]MBA6300844.1 amino-acid N-acetyltransferase [Colwellia sp. MB3u-22]
MNNNEQNYVKWFRNAAPYINAHRGKTVVLMFGGEAVLHPNFANIIHDIALLRSLGVKLVLVHGARPQIEERMEQRNIRRNIENNIRVTDAETLIAVKDATGSMRLHIEALLTMGLVNSPMHGSQIRVSTGNFVIAKPIGVLNGVDYKYTGSVRKIDAVGINTQLDYGSIVLLSPIGYSSTGEVFNLALEDVATKTALALKADKLITFTKDDGLIDESGELIRSCSVRRVKTLLDDKDCHVRQLLLRAIIQSGENGVERCHCVSYQSDTALLQELFTRDGAGTLIAKDHKEEVCTASIDDVGGILELIAPLEEEGILVKRSRELLEIEIDRFTVIKKEDVIIACAALYPYQEASSGEIACVAIHPDYRNGNRGEHLMEALEGKAHELNLISLFVLTTVSGHWFREQGFIESSMDDLPEGKKQMYNFQRKSKVLIKYI